MPNIVPLDMPAAYWRDKAQRARRGGAYEEAVRLYRAALRRHDDGVSRRELAATYADMRSFAASDRLYMENLARDAGDADSLYGLARNRSLQNDRQAMADLLDLYLRIAPCGAQADEAREILWNTPEETPSPGKRLRRAQTLYYQASDCAQDIKRALRLARLSWRRGHLPDTAKLLCELFLRAQRPASALRYATLACGMAARDVSARLLLASALKASGLPRACRAALGQAMALCEGEENAAAFVRGAIALDCADLAAQAAQKRVDAAPRSTDALLLLAFSLRAAGREEPRVKNLLETVLALDEDDPLARALLEEEAAGEGSPARASGQAWLRRFRRVEQLLAQGEADAADSAETLHREVTALMRLPFPGALEMAVRLFMLTRDARGLRLALLRDDLPPAALPVLLSALRDLHSPEPYFARVEGRLCLLPQKPRPPYDGDLHLLMRALVRDVGERVPLDDIVRNVPPAWRSLPQSARLHCAECSDKVWLAAFAAFLYACAGDQPAAEKRIAKCKTPLRAGRAYMQLIRRMKPAYEMH